MNFVPLGFAKYFRGERLQLSAMLQRIGWQSRLQAGLCQKGFAVPFPLDGNLRQ